MSQSPSNEYLSKVYSYKDLLFQRWPEVEKSLPFDIRDVQNNPAYIKELFISLLKFSATYLDEDSPVWSDISWLFTELLEKKFGSNCFEKIDKRESFRLMNSFKNNKNVVLERIYIGREVSDILE